MIIVFKNCILSIIALNQLTEKAFRHAGVSLTVTSVTDVAAFAIGAVTVGNNMFS